MEKTAGYLLKMTILSPGCQVLFMDWEMGRGGEKQSKRRVQSLQMSLEGKPQRDASFTSSPSHRWVAQAISLGRPLCMLTKVARCGLKSQQIQCKFKINPFPKFPLFNVHPKSCGRRQQGGGGRGRGRGGRHLVGQMDLPGNGCSWCWSFKC